MLLFILPQTYIDSYNMFIFLMYWESTKNYKKNGNHITILEWYHEN